MARGDVTIFQEFALHMGNGEHDLDADDIKALIITNTTPSVTQAAPQYTTYSGSQVGEFVGGYVTGGININATYTEAAGVGTLDGDDIALTQNAGGFDDAYWIILYNDTNATKFAIGFVELAGAVSQVDGPIDIYWGGDGILTTTVTP